MNIVKGSDLFIPEDLLMEILSLLPVLSLLRFKCVCKTWYDLIANPIFAFKQFSKSDNHVSRILIVGHNPVLTESSDFRILSHDTLNVVVEDFRFIEFPNQFLSQSNEYYFKVNQRLLGSYSGLVCLADVPLREFAFWNPATGQSKLICQSTKISARHYHTEHAFGYDFKGNDYKVMRFSPISYVTPYEYETEVYTFYTDTWRNTGAAIPYGVCFDDCDMRPTICVKGVYSTMAYIHAKEREGRNYFLCTIDMSNEEFILTPMPDAINFKADFWQRKVLIELNESVAFLKYIEGYCVVSILNDYGAEGVWTNLYTISSPFISPIGSWKNEILFNGCNELILFNPRTRDWKNFGVWSEYEQVLEYTESLVWVDEGSIVTNLINLHIE